MSSSRIQSISQDKFLLLAINLLHQSLIDPTRNVSRALYKRLFAGEVVQLATVRLDDGGSAAFALSLAHGEFRGRLHFAAFRASLRALVANIASALRERRQLSVFNALDGGDAMLFGITAVTLEDGQHNVMMLATTSSEDGSATVLQLMYLDPAQFAGDASAAHGEAAGAARD